MKLENHARSCNLILTCEHAGNRIPPAYINLFKGKRSLLDSHRGWDPGALEVTRFVARRLGIPYHHVMWSRLLVESNRSPANPRIWSAVTSSLPLAERRKILEKYWWPNRRAVLDAVERGSQDGQRVVHVAVHSFTPELDGEVRNADIGLLYDPSRPAEMAWCRRLRAFLAREYPEFRVRMNYPYQGRADGLPTWLRKKFPDRRYAGMELEFSQAVIGSSRWSLLKRAIADSLASECW